jgi:ATP-dependent Lon protease
MPEENIQDLKEIPPEVKDALTITPVETVEEVLTALDIPFRTAVPQAI